MPNLYVIVLALVAVFGTLAFVVSRMRTTPQVDYVSQSVLNRIRTEYR